MYDEAHFGSVPKSQAQEEFALLDLANQSFVLLALLGTWMSLQNNNTF